MAFTDRIPLIRRIEELRQSRVVCYLTSVRPGINAAMMEDAVRVMFEQMLELPRELKKLDIFLCSNGGSGTVPWRLISLFREYADSIGVLIPFRAYSAASLLALGADEIVMHQFAEMGPIDPSVSNDFNPVDPNSRQRISISVEDVKAYLSFIKTTVGIHHEDELIKAVDALIQKVHPLALGTVERFISQSRLIAEKLLRTHRKPVVEHDMQTIIEMMASKLFFHGHPINRLEARKEIGLKVMDKVPAELEKAMWALYLDFEAEMQNRLPFDPMGEIFKKAAVANPGVAGAPAQPAPAPGGGQIVLPQAVLAQMQGNIPPGAVPLGTSVDFDLLLTLIESRTLSARQVIKKRLVP
jgi:hypothetical protein